MPCQLSDCKCSHCRSGGAEPDRRPPLRSHWPAQMVRRGTNCARHRWVHHWLHGQEHATGHCGSGRDRLRHHRGRPHQQHPERALASPLQELGAVNGALRLQRGKCRRKRRYRRHGPAGRRVATHLCDTHCLVRRHVPRFPFPLQPGAASKLPQEVLWRDFSPERRRGVAATDLRLRVVPHCSYVAHSPSLDRHWFNHGNLRHFQSTGVARCILGAVPARSHPWSWAAS